MLIPRIGTAPMTEVPAKSSAAIQWIRQFSMPEDRLAQLAARDCEARELLQFARVPYATEVDGQWVMGDLRFDREQALGFTEIALDGKSGCRFSAPWVPPREALLARSGRLRLQPGRFGGVLTGLVSSGRFFSPFRSNRNAPADQRQPAVAEVDHLCGHWRAHPRFCRVGCLRHRRPEPRARELRGQGQRREDRA